MSNGRTAHATGQAMRYHTNPVMSRLRQTDADHSWGVAMIILWFNPNASKELIGQAIVHDSGEKWAGDLSYPFKRLHPTLGELHAEAERALSAYHKIPEFVLTDEERKWLKFADRLECHYYAEIYHSELTNDPSWDKTKELIIELGGELGIENPEGIFDPQNNLFT